MKKKGRTGRTSRKDKPKTILEWMEVHEADDYPNTVEMVAACAKDLRVKERSVRDKLVRREIVPGKKRSKGGIDRIQFRAQFDTDTLRREAIRNGLQTIGATEILSDNQFRSERCKNCGTGGWRQIAEEDEFVSYQFRCGGKIWWATKASVRWCLENVSKAKAV